MDKGILGDFLTKDALLGLVWGAGGGAIVAIVTKSSIREIIGRLVVGGIVAAAAAPYLADKILNMPTTSAAYPFVCTSLGILGYQLVQTAIEQPEKLPIIGRIFASVSPASSVRTDGQQPSAPPQALPKAPVPPLARPGSVPGVPVDDWTTRVTAPDPAARLAQLLGPQQGGRR